MGVDDGWRGGGGRGDEGVIKVKVSHTRLAIFQLSYIPRPLAFL